MKKTFLIIMLLMLHCTVAWAADVFSMRGVTLGMNRQTVAKIETGTPVDAGEDADVMLYYEIHEPVFGLESSYAMYYFTNRSFSNSFNIEEDRLFSVGLISKYYDVMDDANMTLDFKRFIAELEKNYGAPDFYGLMENDELYWFDNKGGYENMAQSFKNGLTGWVFWQTPDFYINVNMINNTGPYGSFICLTGVLVPEGPLGRKFALKE